MVDAGSDFPIETKGSKDLSSLSSWGCLYQTWLAGKWTIYQWCFYQNLQYPSLIGDFLLPRLIGHLNHLWKRRNYIVLDMSSEMVAETSRSVCSIERFAECVEDSPWNLVGDLILNCLNMFELWVGISTRTRIVQWIYSRIVLNNWVLFYCLNCLKKKTLVEENHEWFPSTWFHEFFPGS